MIRQENINFVASKYAPNPTEVAYWIDLSADSSGNVIKSNTNGMWIPINNSDNTDQTEQINQIKSNLNAEISRATQAEQNLATTLCMMEMKQYLQQKIRLMQQHLYTYMIIKTNKID